MTKFYRKSKSGDFFVKRELYLDLDHELNADVDDEHLSKHQLTNICNTIVDESPDDLIDLMKKADSYEALFLEVSEDLHNYHSTLRWPSRQSLACR